MSTLDETLAQAVRHHQTGRLAEAEALYRRLLETAPGNTDALHLLGLLAHQTGHSEAAAGLIGRAVAVDGAVPTYHNSLAGVLRALGRLDEAEAGYRRALSLDPSLADASYNLGNLLRTRNRAAEAVTGYRAALAARPEFAAAWLNLALALQESGQPDDAEAACHAAIILQPAMPEAHYNLGRLLQTRHRIGEAETAFRHAVDCRPDHADALNNLGAVQQAAGRLADAEVSLRRALAAAPDHVDAHENLGSTLQGLGRLDEAEASLRRALTLDPDRPKALNNLGVVVQSQGRVDEAIACFRQALDRPRHPDAVEDAVKAHTNLLTATLYTASWDNAARFAEHRRFDQPHPARPHARPPDPGRRLRIGYLSSDFRDHPVARNLLPLMAAHDRSGFDWFLYAEVASPDTVTQRFQALADGWRDTVGRDDATVAGMIRDDRIDILVCLAGRFDRNRPLVCAHRPAPIQISFHDVATSGLAAMDYLITDGVMSPRQSDERFTERLLRLPRFYLAAPLTEAPPPARSAGPITFGCFNNPAKLSPEALSLWARLLARVPGSRLSLKYANWFRHSAPLRDRIHAPFAAAGIDPARIELVTAESEDRAAHLARYHAVDIALDPFPFSGSTTSFEALWMGVPVVTLPRDTMASRWTAAMLAAVGFGDLVARTPEHYLEIAAELAADPTRRTDLRQTLRDRVATSPLCDAKGRARQIERLYRAVWRRWCLRRTG